MFHTVSAESMPGMLPPHLSAPAYGAYIPTHQPPPHNLYDRAAINTSGTGHATMLQTFPIQLSDGRTAMCFVPPTTVPPQLQPPPSNTSAHWTTSAANASSPAEHLPPYPFPATTSSSAVPTSLASHKANTSTTTTNALLQPRGTTPAVHTHVFDLSTTSQPGASASSVYASTNMQQHTAVPAPPGQTILVVDSTTGQVRALAADEVAAVLAGKPIPTTTNTTSTPAHGANNISSGSGVPSAATSYNSYPMTAAYAMHMSGSLSQAASLSATNYPSTTVAMAGSPVLPAIMHTSESLTSANYTVAHAPPYGATPVNSVFTPSLSGTGAGASLTGLPPPPPPPLPPKTINGLQYQHGELYEGFVKRYNPNRGFGFLTATHHVLPDTISSTLQTPLTSLTAVPAGLESAHAAASSHTSSPAPKERRVPAHLGDIFVHQSYMHMQGFRTLPVGGRVRFHVGYKDGQQTFQAVDVELLPQVVPQCADISAASCVNPAVSATSVPTGAHADVVGTSSSSSASSAPSVPQRAPMHGLPPLLLKSSAPLVELAVTTPSDFSKPSQHRTPVTPEVFEKAIGSVGSPSGAEMGSEEERFFFPLSQDKVQGNGHGAVGAFRGSDEDDIDDSPLVELAYGVYTSLEE